MPDNHSVESLSKSSLVSSDTNSSSWIADTLLKPSYDAGVVTPYNAVANVINGTNHTLGGDNVLPKLELANYKQASTLSTDWVVQNAVSGLIAAIPYVVAGKAAGIGLRGGGTMLNLEGKSAKFLASDVTAQITGAAMYDGMRDVNDGETRRGNVLAGATMFGVYAGLNPLTREMGILGRVGSRIGIGALGAASATIVSSYEAQGSLPDAQQLKDSLIKGGSMNLILPHLQSKIGAAIDNLETKATGSMPLDRFVAENDLKGGDTPRSKSLELFGKEFPLARVSADGGSSSKNTISMDKSLLYDLNNTDRPDLQEAARDTTAQYLGEQLSAKLRASRGIPEGILSNTGIESAIRQGRLVISDRDANGADQPIRPEPKTIGNNGIDLHLDDRFVIIPKSGLINFAERTPKDVLKDWPVTQLKDGITLQPGDLVLGFTSEKITLPGGPEPEWNGHPALIGEINSPSSIGRMGLENHQTAPVINNGTDNRITLEIVNNNPNPIHLVPGMKIASMVFRTMTGHPEGSAQKSDFNGQKQPNGAKGDRAVAPQRVSVALNENDISISDSSRSTNAEVGGNPSTTVSDPVALRSEEFRFPAADPDAAARIEALGQNAHFTMTPARMGEIHDLPYDGASTSPPESAVAMERQFPVRVGNQTEELLRMPASNPNDIRAAAELLQPSLVSVTADNMARIHNARPTTD